MKNIKGYEGLEKDSYEEYTQLMEDMDTDVKMMFKLIDEGNVDKYKRSFLTSYVDWQKLKKLILQNPLNDCGHNLHNDIEKAYEHIITVYADELYYTF